MPNPDEAVEAPTATLLAYRDYRYAVVVSATGLVAGAVHAELWYQIPGAGPRRPWRCFARRTAIDAGKARATVEVAFKCWVEGQTPAAAPTVTDRCRWCGGALARDDHEAECEACRQAHERYRRRHEGASGD